MTQTLGVLTHNIEENASAKYALYLAKTNSDVFSSKPQLIVLISFAANSSLTNVAVFLLI